MKNLNNNHFDTRKKAITYSLIGTLLFNGFLMDLKSNNTNIPIYSLETTKELNIDDIKDFIYASEYLTKDEKDFLYNEDFLSDILPLINGSIISRIRYQAHLTNIAINNYGKNDHGSDYLGYYNPLIPNELNIRDYDDFNINKDTLAHEFIHLCQDIGGYNTITEASAEIMSYEYFDGVKIDSYSTQVRLLKKLMEIIGSEPIWIYNFTGDFTLIENEVKPYLTQTEYFAFLSCLSFKHGDDENNRSKFETLDNLISTIYKNKYGEDITNSEIMQVLDNPTNYITRYYFNKRLIDKEHSYYYNRSNTEFGSIDYETAFSRNIFYAYAVRYDPLTLEEALDAIDNNTFPVLRSIDFSKNEIIIKHQTNRSYETLLDCTIDGVEYHDVSVDDLARDGIITINYYKSNYKKLTAQEYLNNESFEGAKIFSVYSHSDLNLFKDHIEGLIPKIVYLEPFGSSHEMTKKLTN